MLNTKKLKFKTFIALIFSIIIATIFLSYTQPVEAKEQSRYQIRVDLTENLVFIDEWNDESQTYTVTEHIFLCSPGKASTPTPTGTFTAKPRAVDWQYDPDGTGEWVRFRSWESCYVNGSTIISGAIYFHSVPCTKPDYAYVSQTDIDLMGSASSHGCVRLWPRQAAWIRENCSGATVKIYYGEGYNDDLWRLRERLKKEAPPKELWPNTVITEKTKFIYTYYGDTLEGLAEMAGITEEELIELNTDLDLLDKSIAVGLAIRIKN